MLTWQESTRRKLDKGMIESLTTCQYILERCNITNMGASSAGKSCLACALFIEACKRLYKVKYYRIAKLLGDLAATRGEGHWHKVLNAIRKLDLLVPDECMLINMNEHEARDFLEIVSALHKRASTIFCSQYSSMGFQ